jgi:hypothetical protein
VTLDHLHQIDRPTGRTIRDIKARKFEGLRVIVAAAGVELRGVVRKGEKVFLKKLVEAGSSGAKFRLGFLEPILRNKHLGEAPADFRVTARNYRQKQNLCLGGLVFPGADFWNAAMPQARLPSCQPST